MILPRCLVLAAVLCAAVRAGAQTPAPSVAPAGAFAGDERAARLAERYKAMLAANPAEGIALDRLWQSYEDHAATGGLLDEYRDKADRNGGMAAWLIYGHLLKKTGRFDAAAAAYDAAEKAEPTGALPLLAQGELALARHQPEEAARLFSGGMAKLPPNDHRRTDLLLKIGNAWLAAGQSGKAIESWEQLIAANPGDLVLHKQLAETYERNHLADKALVHLEYLDQHADPPGRAAALREEGRLHESRGEFEAARDAFERALALTARDNWLHGELLGAIIRLYERAGRTSELEARWRHDAEQAPRDLGGYLRLETLAETQGDTKAELEWLDRITALAPRDRDSRLKLARLLVDSGRRERAATVYDHLLKDQPDQLDLIFARADLDLQLGATADAVSRVEARLAKTPDDETVSAAALEFFSSRHLDEPAERCLRAAAARQPAALNPGVALAKFDFARRRLDDGRRVMNHLADVAGASGTPPERLERLAAVYKDENLPDDALRCWQEAARLAPNDPAPLEAASELLVARGDSRAAADALQKAVAAVPDGPAREEIDHKLFQVLSADVGSPAAAAAGFGTVPEASRRRHEGYVLSLRASGLAPTPPEPGAVFPGSALDRYLEGLEGTASREPTVGNLLRLARWQLWSRLLNEAAASAEKAIALDPANLPARQLFIRLATEAHQHPLAARRLHEIIALDPAHRSAYLRQLAGMQMEDGDYDAALAGYSQLQEAQPGSVEALTDLALAQQRAEHWFDALATWKRAYALPSLTPVRRGDVRRPLLAVYEHLGEFPPAAELLAHAVDDQPELARKQELFQELSEFCGHHGLVDWLDGQYEARLQAQPDDYFTMVAVADLWKAKGRDEEAYRLLGRAYYSAPDPVAALKSLADEAEALGEDEQAVADRRRLAGMAGQDTAENLEKLAASEEEDLDDDEAARTWEQIATRFPRDTDALAHAADFFERSGQPERSRALLDRIVAIEPGDLPHRFHLAELARDAGDSAEAREGFEQVLAHSAAERPGESLHLPPDLETTSDPTGRFGGAAIFFRPPPSPKPAATGSDDHVLRLPAIGELAVLLRAPNGQPAAADPGLREARTRWLEHWRTEAASGLRSEPLQALYAAGDVPGTMDLLAGWTAEHPADPGLRGAFLLAGLRLGDYARLAGWAWADGGAVGRSVRAQQLVDALQQFLATGGRPGANIVGELFPEGVRARDILWKTAKDAFAERRWYAPAAELGERVLALATSGRAAYAVELAQWELLLDRPDRARAALRALIDEGNGVSLDRGADGAIYEALRAYYLLLPVDERATFVTSYLSGWEDRGETVHRVLSGVVLHGLQGDETGAHRDLDALLALRLALPGHEERSLDARRWSYLLDAGVQLESWHLEALAAYLWRGALHEGTAFERRDGEVQGILDEIRSRLVLLDIAAAPDPEESRERAAEYLSTHPREDFVRSAATQLLASAEFPAARQFCESLVHQEPGENEVWRNLLVACEGSGDLDAMEAILTSLLETARPAPPPFNRAETIRALAALRQSEGDDAGALRLLAREFQRGNRAVQVVGALAACYERAGMLADAARVYEEAVGSDYANARSYRLELARIEERRGNLPQAISWLEAEAAGKAPPGTGEAAADLVRLYLRTGQVEKAKDLTLGLLKTNTLGPLPAVRAAFVQAGQGEPVREWLRSAVRRSRDPQTRFLLQEQLLDKDPAAPGQPPRDFAREMRRLKRFAQATPPLKSTYENARYALARGAGADPWLEGELQREWKDGRGEFSAGEQLVVFYLATRQVEPLRRVVRAIDARPNLPEQSLASIEQRLSDANLADIAAPISERLYRRFPQNEVYALARARVLWKTGQAAEADRILEALDRTSVFREDLSTRIAALYEELGDAERARDFYGRAVRRDPADAHSVAACLRLAQMATDRKRWPEARQLWQAAYRHPVAASDLNPLANFLQASGGLDAGALRGLPGSGFALTFPKRAQLLSLIYQRLKSQGRLPEAQALVLAHPGFLAVSPALTAAWRQDARPEQVPACIAALEEAASLEDAPSPRVSRDLAALYTRWSDDEANAVHPDIADRLSHLVRAQQLAPDDFEIARRLAALCWEHNQPDRAVAALQPFLAADAIPAEGEQARVLLAKH